MSQPPDTWYVRFPDGRVVRAPSTHVLRQHLGTGHIPFNSRVRRSEEEEWVALDWMEEFADLVPPAGRTKNAVSGPFHREAEAASAEPGGIAARLDAMRLRTVGLRGLVDELMAALDNTLSRPKLVAAGAVGVLSGLVVAVAGSLTSFLPRSEAAVGWIVAGLVLLLLGVIASVVLTQLTYIEVSRLRPARWREARRGLGRLARRLFAAARISVGGPMAGIVFLRWLSEPGRLGDIGTVGPAAVTVVSLLGEVVLWPLLAFALLLAPVVVVEECSAWKALAQWWSLVRGHLGRLFLYESAAVAGGMATLIFALPLALAAWARRANWGGFDTAQGFSLCLLAGLAAAPLIAYLAVAHVFIYLNLRYEVRR